ncbi:hypothetical protein D9M71_700640 [compost metagenome]
MSSALIGTTPMSSSLRYTRRCDRRGTSAGDGVKFSSSSTLLARRSRRRLNSIWSLLRTPISRLSLPRPRLSKVCARNQWGTCGAAVVMAGCSSAAKVNGKPMAATSRARVHGDRNERFMSYSSLSRREWDAASAGRN